MLRFILPFLTVIVTVFSSCSSQRKQPANVVRDTVYIKDSVEYYETDFDVRQVSYMEELLGTWDVRIMKRQAMMEAENLNNVFITFNRDSSFTGNGGCNHISGKYSLKGTSIVFKNIISTKMACERLEQESAFLNLLQNTVSAFTVNKNSLLLRDVASNVVFEAGKR